jgi:GNAT superfamily N-acetyltransferase
VIELSEERYDSPEATELVRELHADINERYAAEIEQMTAEEVAEDDAAYLAEVTPELVAPPLGTFVVAHLDGRPVGCGALKPVDGQPGVAEIKRMYTRSTARRRGVSRRILARLEQAAVDLGYREIRLETGAEQPEAVALYEAHGWHRIAPYGRYKDSPSSICFAKDLTA